MEGHNVTITILDAPLSLVHIPRSRLAELNRPILKQLLRKKPKFLNLTANEIELSIFAEDDELVDFEPIARRDRHRQRLRESVSSTPGRRHRHRSHSYDDTSEPVEMSFEKWRVLQIDSHDDSLSTPYAHWRDDGLFVANAYITSIVGTSGSRVTELSAPLAAAGISILYQSSYLSDFICVKASRLPEVIKILGDEGFTLYNTNPYESYSSPSPAAAVSITSNSHLAHLHDEASYPGPPGTTSPAVFSRTRSPSVTSLAILSNAMSKSCTVEDIPSILTMHRTKTNDSSMSSSGTSCASRTPQKSPSPTAAPVEVLSPDLACVGLNENAADVWSVKIITLVGYPELIPTPNIDAIPNPSRVSYYERRNSLTASLYGSAPRVSQRGLPSPVAGPRSSSAVFDLDPEHSDAGGDSDNGVVSPASPSYSSPCSNSDGDEYLSSPSPYNRTRASSGSTPSLVSSTSRSSARSLPERLDEIWKSERPRLSKISTDRTLHSDGSRKEQHQSCPRTESKSKSPRNRILRVPFFSFTRTEEGSSLTTDIRALSVLFSDDERHMLICPESLLDTGDELNARAAAERQLDPDGRQQRFDLDDEGVLGGGVPYSGTMKCLQIDLQKFGLDKFGLVNRFSRVLEENGINHMYSSTYKTANLLVHKAHAGRAQSLLRSC